MDAHCFLGDLSEMKSLIQNAFGVICALCLSACASASQMPSDDARVLDESMGAVKLLHARLERATDEALQIVRYNPTNCRCPPFEILLSEHWPRVDLAVSDVDNPILGELLRLTSEERAEEALKQYRLTGTFEPTLQISIQHNRQSENRHPRRRSSK